MVNYHYHTLSWYKSYLETFHLVAEEKSCSGTDHPHKGVVKTPAACSTACKKVSKMFIYGRKGTTACTDQGCHCHCEAQSGAINDGRCTFIQYPIYDLYHHLDASKYLLLGVGHFQSSSRGWSRGEGVKNIWRPALGGLKKFYISFEGC